MSSSFGFLNSFLVSFITAASELTSFPKRSVLFYMQSMAQCDWKTSFKFWEKGVQGLFLHLHFLMFLGIFYNKYLSNVMVLTFLVSNFVSLNVYYAFSFLFLWVIGFAIVLTSQQEKPWLLCFFLAGKEWINSAKSHLDNSPFFVFPIVLWWLSEFTFDPSFSLPRIPTSYCFNKATWNS